MRCAKRTFAILALTTTIVGCSATTTPANTPVLTPATLQIYTTTSTRPLINTLATSYNETAPSVSIESRSANYANLHSSLANNEMPYFVTSHLPVESTLWSAPIGQDALAIISHPDSPLEALSLDDLRALYQGHTQQMENSASLILFSRETGAGTRAEFERLVMGSRPILQASRIVSSSQAMIDAVADTPGAIGFVSMGYLNATGQRSRVKVLAIDTITPTLETISANIYPLRHTIFVIGRREPQGAYHQFIEWVQGLVGQAIIGEHYAPLIP